MTITLNHDEVKKQVIRLGWEGFMEKFDEEYHYQFYSCSTHWFDDPKYTCKLKGERGDLVILWEGIHD